MGYPRGWLRTSSQTSGPYIRSTQGPSPDRGEDNVRTGRRLASLAELHASGALTDEEFAAAKAKALGIG
jgi:hypothetical protein